jgi:branched-chain amino acid transport system substrate-binding protein
MADGPFAFSALTSANHLGVPPLEADMKLRTIAVGAALAAAGVSTLLAPTGAFAQAKEQFFPALVYRTGAYAPNGVPFANGYVDYFKLINAKGGINGVKLIWEECETGYATDRGVECYERLKGKHGGATVFQPLSTGITFALTEKAPVDKIPLITAGYGRSESVDGNVFKWNFPLTGTYWDAADVLIQHIAKKEGGLDKLKGKKITLVYHDSPFGKEPIPLLAERSKMHGFELTNITRAWSRSRPGCRSARTGPTTCCCGVGAS